MKIPYDVAILNSTKNRLSQYPTRADDRMEPVSSPSLASGIHLEAGAEIVTTGSCFARNIEEYLGTIGFDITPNPLKIARKDHWISAALELGDADGWFCSRHHPQRLAAPEIITMLLQSNSFSLLTRNGFL